MKSKFLINNNIAENIIFTLFGWLVCGLGWLITIYEKVHDTFFHPGFIRFMNIIGAVIIITFLIAFFILLLNQIPDVVQIIRENQRIAAEM